MMYCIIRGVLFVIWYVSTIMRAIRVDTTPDVMICRKLYTHIRIYIIVSFSPSDSSGGAKCVPYASALAMTVDTIDSDIVDMRNSGRMSSARYSPFGLVVYTHIISTAVMAIVMT